MDGRYGLSGDDEVQDALAAIQKVRARMAARSRWSFARHAAFGAVMGGMVASYGLPHPYPLGGLVLCLLVVALIARMDRRRDGFFVNGYRAGRTRGITVGLALFTVAALLVAMGLKVQWSWSPLLAGAVVLVVTTLGSLAWERAYRRELEER